MEAIYETIRNISVFIILTTVVNNLLHESTYKKYIGFFSGLAVILIVVNPVLDLLSPDNNLLGNIKKYSMQLDTDELKSEMELGEADAYSEISSRYTDMLNASLEHIADEQELSIVESSWKIDMNMKSECYGQISGLDVKVSMSGNIDIGDIRIDESGNVSVENDPNSSLSIRAEDFSEAIAECFCISEDIIDVVVMP